MKIGAETLLRDE